MEPMEPRLDPPLHMPGKSHGDIRTITRHFHLPKIGGRGWEPDHVIGPSRQLR